MLPTLFELGPIKIYSFGLMLALGFLLIAMLAGKEWERRGYTVDDAWSIVFAAMVGGVLGAKIYFLINHWSETVADPRGMIFSGAGLTYYGGLIGGTLAVVFTAKRRKMPPLVVSDICAPFLALGYAVGRLGCFLNGDDYGRASDLPWAMAFPKGAPPIDTPVHPTQVYESLGAFAIFFFLWYTRRRWDDFPGRAIGLSVLLLGIERFLVEFVRLNAPVAAGLTLAQWISVAAGVLGLLLIARSRAR